MIWYTIETQNSHILHLDAEKSILGHIIYLRVKYKVSGLISKVHVDLVKKILIFFPHIPMLNIQTPFFWFQFWEDFTYFSLLVSNCSPTLPGSTRFEQTWIYSIYLKMLLDKFQPFCPDSFWEEFEIYIYYYVKVHPSGSDKLKRGWIDNL